jgi:hypothetical protein
MELYEAKLTKAKLERAEMSTDFTKERLELHKSLVEAKENIDLLLKREENMLEQIDLYKQQAAELQAVVVGHFLHKYPQKQNEEKYYLSMNKILTKY